MERLERIFRICITAAATLTLCLSLPSCSKETDIPDPVVRTHSSSGRDPYFAVKVLPYENSEPETKSWSINYSEMDDDIFDETVAIYDRNGSKVASYYYNYQDAFDGMYDGLENYPNTVAGVLHDGEQYTAYMLVNSRGDKTSIFPSSESGIASMVFDPGDPRDLDGNGIPMVGKLTFYADSTVDDPLVITVQRLYAKVHLVYPTFDYGDYTARIVSRFCVFRLNKRLVPFGVSKANIPSDIYSNSSIYNGYDYDTYQSGTDAWFYVPENMQGTISEILDSEHKSYQENSTVYNKQNLLTFIEVNVSFRDPNNVDYPISGEIYYHSYLGKNETTNFDIQRNCIYNLTFTMTESGLTVDNWKIQNRATWTKYKYRLSVGNDNYDIWHGEQAEATYTLGVGETKTVSFRQQAWRYVNGALVDEERPWNDLASSRISRYTATISEPRVFNGGAQISMSGNTITGVSAGDNEYAYFALNDAHITGPFWDRTQWTLYFHVINTYSVMYRYELEVENGINSVDVGDYVRVRVARYTDNYTNGTRTSTGTTPTYMANNLFNWSSSDTSVATVSSGDATWMNVTGVDSGNITVTAALKSPASTDENTSCTASITVNTFSWGGDNPGDGGETTIEYGTREMYRYVLEAENGLTEVVVDDLIRLRVARYTDTYVDGNRTNIGTTPTYMPYDAFDWMSAEDGIAYIYRYNSQWAGVIGVSSDTVPISATLKESSSKDSNSTCTIYITVLN